MWENITSDRCETYIERHFGKKGKTESKPAITISRAEGAGGLTVSSELVKYLREKTTSHEEWTVFDQKLVVKVLEVFDLKGHVGKFMTEGHKGTVTDAFEEFIGLHPSTWSLVERTNATILRLAKIGTCILVGRGANLVTKDMPNVFHVRLVGSLEKRIEQAMKVFGHNAKEAAKYIKKKDEGRKRYIKDNFDADIDDPLIYHIVINTDLVTYEEAARIIGSEVIRKYNLDAPAKPEIMTGHRAAVF
jgi:cytidylate kinase